VGGREGEHVVKHSSAKFEEFTDRMSAVQINRQDVDWYGGVKWMELAQVASYDDDFGINP
jgi:hypothetical protein